MTHFCLIRVARISMIIVLALVAQIAEHPAASPQLRVYFASDFTDQQYQQKAFDKVAGAWQRPAENPEPGSKAVVVVTILEDGKAGGIRLHFESGSEAWDSAAVAAVEKAAPFDPLPKSYRRDSVEAHFHFEFAE